MNTIPIPRPDHSALIPLATNACASPATKSAYAGALRAFFAWLPAGFPLSPNTVQVYRGYLSEEGKGAGSINMAMAAIKCLAREAASNGLMDQALADGIGRVRGVKILGTRAGNWLDADTARRLLALPDRATLQGRRDAAVLALVLGCGLRRAEAAGIEVQHVQPRDGRTLLVDFEGKGRRVGTVVMPVWAAAEVRGWLEAAGIEEGRVLRRVNKGDHIEGEDISPRGIYWIITGYASKMGIEMAPHDLRRTFAKLARAGGAPIEKIQRTLRHSSIVVTQRYLGTELDLVEPAGDYLGL